MDTKSKNSKRYPLWVKALCVVLSVLCLLGTYVCALYAVMAVQNIRTDSGDPFGKVPDSFYDTAMFCDILSGDLVSIDSLVNFPKQIKELRAIETKKDEIAETQVQRYLQEKAAIIRGEVYYVATHYDEPDDDYYYDAYMRDFSTTTTTAPETATKAQTDDDAQLSETSAVTETTTVSVNDDALAALPKLTVDERAPYNVRYCQKLVNTVTGLDWLRYASFVRTDAFREQEFSPDFGKLGSAYTSFSYEMDEVSVRTTINELLDTQLKTWQENYDGYRDSAAADLDATVNMRYIVVAADGTEYANTENAASADADGLNIVCKNGEVTIEPKVDAADQIAAIVKLHATDVDGQPLSLTVCFPAVLQSGDRYAEANTQYEWVRRFPVKTVLGVGVLCMVGILFFFLTLLCLCGHKAGADGISLSFVDRVPTDIHFLVSWTAIFLSAVLCIAAADHVAMWRHATYADWEERLILYALLPAALCAVWLLFFEWLTSAVRIKKAGQSYFKRFVLWKIVPLLWKCVRFVFRKIRQGVLFILEKPKKIRYVFLLATVVYAAAAVLWTLIAIFGLEEPGLFEFGFAVLTVVYALFQIRYLRALDTIIDRSCDRSSLPIPDTDKMPPALRLLAENLSLANEELDKAVAQAVRDARTKAELITNVSHDLKTPLTSVISYVDLLGQCDISDETARQYLAVLEEKSANLKRLVEDLIEASKVSAGNVELHCAALNLSELATQAVVEATPELEGQGLAIKFTEPPTAPVVFADGTKTYRILDNLLSNVKKYAADNSRVYIRVGEDGAFGLFEIKNISREPLDVEPEALMERFVRGDRSRTQDGNGLGLSIAKELCALQGGRLDIEIDGDLFKATVRLPKAEGGDAQ